MSDLLAEIDRCIRKRKLFCPGQSLVVAVSGGLDSMVLLHLLHRLSEIHEWRLTAAHFNHRLRGRSSDADERLVVQTAKRLHIPILKRRRDVRAFARRQKVSIEMAARELRHVFLASTARRVQASTVVLAHHADDQLELFFLRLLRGSGGDGLSAMRWRGPSPADPPIELVRPFLETSKSALLQYAISEGVPYREDATNTSLDFQRNRIRHELLPLLKARYQPNLETVINRIVDITSAEAGLASAAAAGWLTEAFGADRLACRRQAKAGSGKPNVKASAGRSAGATASLGQQSAGGAGSFSHLPVAVQRRCLQLQLFEQGVSPEFDLIEKLRLEPEVPVCVGSNSLKRAGTEPPGVRALVRDAEGLVRWRDSTPTRQFRPGSLHEQLGEGEGQTEFGGVRIVWSIQSGKFDRTRDAKAGSEVFDADKVGVPILLRFWRPGDRFQPIGMNCSVKLQDFLTNQKVPAARRRDLVLGISMAGEVFWIEGQRISERFKLTKNTIRRLHWSWQRL